MEQTLTTSKQENAPSSTEVSDDSDNAMDLKNSNDSNVDSNSSDDSSVNEHLGCRSETIWSSTRGACPIMLSHPRSMTENDGKLRKPGKHGPYCILLHSACEVRHDVQHNYSRFSTDLWQPQLGAYRVNSMDCGLTNVSPALILEFCFPLSVCNCACGSAIEFERNPLSFSGFACFASWNS